MTEPIPHWKVILGEEEAEAAARAIRDGMISQGPLTARLEERLAELLGVPHVICTTSGSAALFLAVKAAGIGPGDEVILPDRTFIATANAVVMAGASVRLVDVRADIDLMDAAAAEAAVGPRTRAILPVHLNGMPVEMGRLGEIARRRRLLVIEDAAQALLSRGPEGLLGTIGDLGCFSLGVTKLITTGQGGFVVTRDARLRDALEKVRNHGVLSSFHADHDRFGFNFKMSGVLAAVGLVQVEKAQAKIREHLRVYRHYQEALRGVGYLKLLPGSVKAGELPLWVEAVCPKRDRLVELLRERGIEARPALNCLHRSAYLGQAGSFPNSERYERECLYLPCGPDLPAAQLDRVVEVIKALEGVI